MLGSLAKRVGGDTRATFTVYLEYPKVRCRAHPPQPHLLWDGVVFGECGRPVPGNTH